MEWSEGDKVAVYTANDTTGSSVRVRTVARITTSQIVLDDDSRYRRKDLRQVGGNSSAYGPRRELRPLDDPDVRRVRARQAVNRLVRRITNKQAEVERRENGAVALLDYIEREAAAVRAAVEKLADEED